MNENTTVAGVPSASPSLVDAYDQLNVEVAEAPLQPDFSIQAPMVRVRVIGLAIYSSNPMTLTLTLTMQAPIFESLGRWGTPTGPDVPPTIPASLAIQLTFDIVANAVAGNPANDGFLAISSTPENFHFAAYFVPISSVFAALDALRSDILARARANNSGFVWNVPAEMRFLRVTDDAVLNVVPPGVYGVVELLALGATGSSGAADDQGWMKAFHAMEKTFKQLGAVPHVAKEWGLEADSSGYVTKFAAASVCQIYTSATKQAFNAYRLQMDPEGRFAGGRAMSLLVEACGENA